MGHGDEITRRGKRFGRLSVKRKVSKRKFKKRRNWSYYARQIKRANVNHKIKFYALRYLSEYRIFKLGSYGNLGKAIAPYINSCNDEEIDCDKKSPSIDIDYSTKEKASPDVKNFNLNLTEKKLQDEVDEAEWWLQNGNEDLNITVSFPTDDLFQ